MEQILTRCWPGFARWRTYIMMRSHQMIAGFSLNEANWKRFSRFFAPHPTDVLQPHHLSTTSFGRHEGHAVVITGESQDAWFIKTSWREGFAEEGFFRVAKTSIEFSFYDVCFRMCDLTRSERNAYRLAPPLLEVTMVPCRSERNPISSLGWDIDFETLRIERVRKRNWTCLMRVHADTRMLTP